MQFRDLKAQYSYCKNDIDAALLRIAASAHYIGGIEVQALEEELASYVGVKHCITCGNGTDALQLALMAWGIGQGDAVIVPDFTFFSSGEVVSAVGATPVFVDVLEDTFNLDPSYIESAVREAKKAGLNPRAVIAVDLFGQPADYSAIKKECDRFNLLLLEDGAQSFGGAIGSQRACSFGDISTTSFFPAKPLGCYGDGGAVFTDNDDWAELVRSYAIHGKGSMKYDNIRIGMNSRLDAIQAAVLQVKLQVFQSRELTAVNEMADKYTSLLTNIPFLSLPHVGENFTSSWAQYTIKLDPVMNRNEVQETLRKLDVPTMVYYPKPMHEQKAFKNSALNCGELSVTPALCQRVLSLPIGPYQIQDASKVISAIESVFAKQ